MESDFIYDLSAELESLRWQKLYAEKRAERDALQQALIADSTQSPEIRAEIGYMMALVETRMRYLDAKAQLVKIIPELAVEEMERKALEDDAAREVINDDAIRKKERQIQIVNDLWGKKFQLQYLVQTYESGEKEWTKDYKGSRAKLRRRGIVYAEEDSSNQEPKPNTQKLKPPAAPARSKRAEQRWRRDQRIWEIIQTGAIGVEYCKLMDERAIKGKWPNFPGYVNGYHADDETRDKIFKEKSRITSRMTLRSKRK